MTCPPWVFRAYALRHLIAAAAALRAPCQAEGAYWSLLEFSCRNITIIAVHEDSTHALDLGCIHVEA